YRDADLFVLPSQNENFGNTAAEAAACGTPVIVTDQCGIAPYISGAGLVIRHDVAELHGAIASLLEIPDLRARHASGCEDLVRSLSWEGPLEQMEQQYRRCLTEASPR